MGDIYDDIDNILNGTDAPETSAELADEMANGMFDEEKNFNEEELQDIMSEIESLEKEFEGSETMMATPLKKDPVMEELMESAAEAEMLNEAVDDDAVFDEGELDAVLMDSEMAEEVVEDEVSERPSTMTVATNNPLQDVIERELAESLLKEKAQELPAEKVHVLNFEKPAPRETTPTPITSPTPTTKGSEVAFSAQGSMALTLDFKVGTENAKLTIDPTKGLTVTLAGVELVINETEGCHVVMENGMKFSIPLSTLEKSIKKAA